MPIVTYRFDNIFVGSILNGFETGDQFSPSLTGLSNGGFAVAYGNDVTGL